MNVLREEEERPAAAGAPSAEARPNGGEATGNSIGRGPARTAESPAAERPHEGLLRAARVRLERDERLLTEGFLHVHETGEYHWRDHAQEGKRSLAFRDAGDRLICEGQEKMVVEGMVAVAQQKGWTTLEVSGTEEFRRSVWRSAHERGIAVEGYQPTPTDVALVHEKRVRAGLEAAGEPSAEARSPRSAQEVAAFEKTEPFRELARAIVLLREGRGNRQERYERAEEPAFEAAVRREILNRYAAGRDLAGLGSTSPPGEGAGEHEREREARSRVRARG
jgi:hypothetical protein